MAKDKQPQRPRAETPKGFRDYFGVEVIERKAMLDPMLIDQMKVCLAGKMKIPTGLRCAMI
jgi:hypothetical protein